PTNEQTGGVSDVQDSNGNSLVVEGVATLPPYSTDSAEVHTETVFNWSTGQSQIFTVTDSAKVTDVYVQGSRLAKTDEWVVNGATGIEIVPDLFDGDNIAIVSSATSAPGGGSYDDTALSGRVTALENGRELKIITASTYEVIESDKDKFLVFSPSPTVPVTVDVPVDTF